MTTPLVKLDASDPNGYSGIHAKNLVTGAQWTMHYGTRNSHFAVPVFDMEDYRAYLQTNERLAFCSSPTFATTTATWLDWTRLQAALIEAQTTAESMNLELIPIIDISSELPLQLVVRVADIVRYRVPSTTEPVLERFEELLLSGPNTDLLPPPRLTQLNE